MGGKVRHNYHKLPDEYVDYLVAGKNPDWSQLAIHDNLDGVSLLPLSELKVEQFRWHTSIINVDQGFQFEEEGYYLYNYVNLTDFGAPFLVWFVDVGWFGQMEGHDGAHNFVLDGVSWSEIAKHPGDFLAGRWDWEHGIDLDPRAYGLPFESERAGATDGPNYTGVIGPYLHGKRAPKAAVRQPVLVDEHEPQRIADDFSPDTWWYAYTEDRHSRNFREAFEDFDQYIEGECNDGQSWSELTIPRLHTKLERFSKAEDTVHGGEPFVFSAKLCRLLKALDVPLETFPLDVTIRATQEHSANFYRIANVPCSFDAVFFVCEEKPMNGPFIHPDAIEFVPGSWAFPAKLRSDCGYTRGKVYGRFGILHKVDAPGFVTPATRGHGLVVNDRVKRSMEQNHISGFVYEPIHLWREDEVDPLIQSATAGDAQAAWRLANLYLEGLLVEPNLERAIDWFDRAAQAPTTDAIEDFYNWSPHHQNFGGWRGYVFGHLARKRGDIDSAISWFENAATEGHPRAQTWRDKLAVYKK